MKRWLAGAVVLAVFAGPEAVRADNDERVLDGRTFVGQIQPKGESKWEPDTFRFEDGRFESSFVEGKGYAPGPYTARKDGNTVWFESVTEGPDGDIHWKGSVIDDRLRGTMTVDRGRKWYRLFLPSTQENIFEARLQP
jgi:hypothetical protein